MLLPAGLYAGPWDAAGAGFHARSHQSAVRDIAAASYVQQILACNAPNESFRGGDRELQPWIASATEEKSAAKPFGEVLRQAGRRALGGGLPGAAAMGIQVCSLMWLRTTVNYQYRYGTTTTAALQHLYREGGIVRFYRGVGPALLQGPLSRFGDTAANAGTLSLLDSYDSMKDLPIGLKTVAASFSAGAFRILLMPVDACKTTMQVEGKDGFAKLTSKVRANGVRVLYHGSLAAWAATFVGHWPWFAVYNTLNESLPQYDDLPKRLMRSAIIGFSASAVSDTCSNSIRVIKTTKQTSSEAVTYPQVLKASLELLVFGALIICMQNVAPTEVLEKEGVLGLLGRGLKTKILSNGLQGLLFTVLWRLGQDMWNKKFEDEPEKK